MRRWPAYEAMSADWVSEAVALESQGARELTRRVVLEEAEHAAIIVRDEGELAFVDDKVGAADARRSEVATEHDELVRILLRRTREQASFRDGKETSRTWNATSEMLCCSSPIRRKFLSPVKVVTWTPTSRNPIARRNSSCSNARAYSF